MQCKMCGSNMYHNGLNYPTFTKRRINGKIVQVTEIAHSYICIKCGHKVTLKT